MCCLDGKCNANFSGLIFLVQTMWTCSESLGGLKELTVLKDGSKMPRCGIKAGIPAQVASSKRNFGDAMSSSHKIGEAGIYMTSEAAQARSLKKLRFVPNKRDNI